MYNGTNQCVLTYNDADITETNKIAFTYAANDFALYVNGESRSTDVFGVTFSAGALSDGVEHNAVVYLYLDADCSNVAP